MNENLNRADLDTILESLVYSMEAVRNGENIPTYKSKMERVVRIERVMNKVRKLKKEWIDV